MQRVAGAVGGDLARDRTADQREIAQQIEDLVPYEFVAKAKRRLAEMEPRVNALARADEIAEAVTEKMTAARRGLLTTGEKLGGACVGAAAIASVVLQLFGH